jgi:RNA polymerase sigma-70 factor (ECF subfamily)
LYDRLRSHAYRQAGNRAHKIDPSLAALDALVQAALRRSQFRGTTREEFWAWLRTILVNQVREGLRRAECRNVSLDECRDAPEPSPPTQGPAAEAVRAEDVAALGRAIEQLPAEDRDLICLYHRSDVPRPLIAEMLGISDGSLRKRAERARKRLKELMSSPEDPDNR